MVDWHLLRHAYGPAGDIPALLAALRPDPEADVWNELWGRVCHQGSVYTSSLPVLPYLLQAASSWPATNRVMPLTLAGAIVSSQDVVGSRDLAAFRATIDDLHQLALDSLLAGHANNDFIHLLQAARALGGDELWGRKLDLLTGGELDGICEACGVLLYLVIGEYGCFATAEEWVNRPSTKRVPITPCASDQLSGVGAWLHSLALQAGQQTLANWFQYLFGSTACPKCHHEQFVSSAIARTCSLE